MLVLLVIVCLVDCLVVVVLLVGGWVGYEDVGDEYCVDWVGIGVVVVICFR